jgi:hypothetical protein
VEPLVERTTDVFFYGWFMDPDLLRERGLEPSDPRLAAVDGYRFRIGERAALEPVVGEQAHGVVVGLTQTELDRLYADPSVSMYRPEVVVARLLDGRLIEVACYNTALSPDSPPNQAYLARWREIATKVGLPESYVATAGSET